MGACFAVSVESNFRQHTCSDGQVYEGDWNEDKRNGKGKCSYSNGHTYDGDWKDDERIGKGMIEMMMTY